MIMETSEYPYPLTIPPISPLVPMHRYTGRIVRRKIVQTSITAGSDPKILASFGAKMYMGTPSETICMTTARNAIRTALWVRSYFPAPTFCPMKVVMASPSAVHGMPANWSMRIPAPMPAMAAGPKLLMYLWMKIAEMEIRLDWIPAGRPRDETFFSTFQSMLISRKRKR